VAVTETGAVTVAVAGAGAVLLDDRLFFRLLF